MKRLFHFFVSSILPSLNISVSRLLCLFETDSKESIVCWHSLIPSLFNWVKFSIIKEDPYSLTSPVLSIWKKNLTNLQALEGFTGSQTCKTFRSDLSKSSIIINLQRDKCFKFELALINSLKCSLSKPLWSTNIMKLYISQQISNLAKL